MAQAALKTRRMLRAIATGAIVPLGWALLFALNHGPTYRVQLWVDDAILRVLSGFPEAQLIASRLFELGTHSIGGALFTIVTLATFGIPLGFVARMIARARVRSGAPDPLERARAWAAAHPWGLRAALATPALLYVLGVARSFMGWNDTSFGFAMIPALFAAPLLFAAARNAHRGLLVPFDDDGAAKLAIDEDEIVFDAVAVTREAKAAVAVVGGASLAMVVWIASRPIAHLFTDPRIFAAMAAYIVMALSSAVAFQRASRVAVGIDGVRVYGTSRTRFYAYRDLDEARVARGDLQLVRKGRVVLALQLHGEDTARQGAVLARITDRIAASQDRRVAGAQRFVEGKSRAEVARVAMGGGDYRAPSITRDQLWQLVEGATTDAASRTAAAGALVRTLEAPERARLRVAADRCAEPRVRVALTRLAEGEPLDEEPPLPEARREAAAP